MKKLLFTSLTLLMFSGVPRANTIDLNKRSVRIESTNTFDLIAQEEDNDCCLYSAMDGTDAVSSKHTMSNFEVYELYEFLYELCILSGSTGYF